MKSSQADRFGRGHPTHSPPHTPASQTASFCENLDPFLSYIKRQNNPKHGNLSRNVHIYLTASGEGVNPSGQPDRLFTVFIGPRLTWGPIYGSGCHSATCVDLTDVIRLWLMKIPTQYLLIMPIGQSKAMWQCKLCNLVANFANNANGAT